MRAAHLLVLALLMTSGNTVHAQDHKQEARVAALSEGLYACLLIVAPKGSEIAKLAEPLPSGSIIETAKAIVRSGSDTRAEWEFSASTHSGVECSARTVTYGKPEVEFRHIEPAMAALHALARQRGVAITQSGEVGSRVWSVGGLRIEEYRGTMGDVQHSVSFTVKRPKAG